MKQESAPIGELGRAYVEESEAGLTVGYEDYGVAAFGGADYEVVYTLGRRAAEKLRQALEQEGFPGPLTEAIPAYFGPRLEKRSFARFCQERAIHYQLDTWTS